MSSKPTPRPGIYKADSIIDVADSLGITNLPEEVANALASDVEYRLHQVIEEASRFTRHSRRTIMTTSDVDQAFKTLNIEPVYGHSAHTPLSFRRVQPPVGPPIYVLEDDEVDFERVLKEDPIPVPRSVRYTAHWLAIEGIQPLIPENPPPEVPAIADQPANSALVTPPPTQNGSTSNTPADSTTRQVTRPPSVKTHLSRELQHYYQRLVSSLVPSAEERKKTAALTSLRADAGLAPVLPYITRWVGEGVVNTLRREGLEGDEMDLDRRSLDIYLDVLSALLENERLFVEPYLHQFLPPILSILLTSTLFIPQPLAPTPSDPSPSHLRTHSSSVLARLLLQHSATYPSLASRVTKTLLAALVEPGRMLGTREGALRGLISVGREAVKRGLLQASGGKIVSDDMDRAREMGMDTRGVEQALVDSLEVLQPRLDPATDGVPLHPLNDMDDEDRAAADALSSGLGNTLASTIGQDATWAKSLARVISDVSLPS